MLYNSSRRLCHLESGITWNMSVATKAGKKKSENDMLQLELFKWLHQTAKGLENSLSVCPGKKWGLDMSEHLYLYYYSVGKENETRWQAFGLEPCTQQVVNHWQLLIFLLYVNWGISLYHTEGDKIGIPEGRAGLLTKSRNGLPGKEEISLNRPVCWSLELPQLAL